jgi:DNA-binding response OmpR family regulator
MTPRALVVEDDGPTRRLLQDLLEERGCEVDVAVDGQQALNLLAENDYGVIVLDIVLPRISGTVVMEYLHERKPELLSRIIVVTGVNVNEIRVLYPNVCAALGKPVIPSRLLQTVNVCLGRADAHFTAP